VTAPVSAHDVAREIRARLGDGIGAKKLQKLLYYCQGWHLAWTGRPLFSERIEAWDMGPVVVDQWIGEKRASMGPAPLTLSGEQSSIVDYVLKRYGDLTGAVLGAMTHNEAPWREAVRNQTITQEAMRSFFETDEAMRARNSEAARIRAHSDMYTLGPRPLDTATLEAIDRARRGEVIRER
jgi:uncharacterized phage-associated protein